MNPPPSLAYGSYILPPPPQSQALTSKTFRPPPLDASLTLPEIYDWHLQKTPDHPLFIYTDDDGRNETIFWPKAVRAVHRTARLMRDRLGCDPEKAPDTSAGIPVIAIVAAADTITYATILIGVMRAGYTVFAISPRNSPAAIAHLISKQPVTHILMGHESVFHGLVKASLDLLQAKETGLEPPTVSVIPVFDDLYVAESQGQDSDTLEYRRPHWDAPCIILHSSGSTAFPKPITWTHYGLAQVALIPWLGERDLAGQRFACHSMPMFHGMGAMQLSWAASCGLVLSTFKPQSPAVMPTSDTVIRHALASNSDIIFCFPSFIEAWSRNPSYVSSLSKLAGIMNGGGALSKETGDFLTSKGVTIFSLYGCTEGGIMSTILPGVVDQDWEYFRLSPHIKAHFIPDGNGAHELVMVLNPLHTPSVLNAKCEGVDAYASSDLLVPHPKKPGYWKIFGRADDQIIHSTGEKTNPGPLESTLNKDPQVLSAIVFGRGRFQIGALIDLKPEFKFDPTNRHDLATFRNHIWPTVEQMNTIAPKHSTLSKEMIVVASPLKPFTYTAKGTARRQAVIDDYELEINALYAAVQPVHRQQS